MSLPHGDPVPRAGADDGGLPSLSWWSFGACLAITLAIFVGLNPIWRPLDMDAMDRNIGWSYAPIPLLVAAALALERKLGWAAFAMESLKLTLVKFALTFLAANAVWAVVGPPTRAMPERVASGVAASGPAQRPHDPPPVSSIDPASTGRVEGRVFDAVGRPVAGALVWIVAGLEGLVYDPPAEVVVLTDDGHGFGPALSLVQTWQAVELRSTDGTLHTAHGTDAAGKQLFNYPVLPGTPRALGFEKPLGLVTLTCKVHGHDERIARLAVVAHPFATRTDAEGRFRFADVPSGELSLAAWAPDGLDLRRPIRLAAGATLAVELSSD